MDEDVEEPEDDPPPELEAGTVVVVVVLEPDAAVVAVVSAARIAGASVGLEEAKSTEAWEGITRLEALVEVAVVGVVVGGARVVVVRGGLVVVVRGGLVVVVGMGRVVVVRGGRVAETCGCVVVVVDVVLVDGCVTVAGGRAANPASVRAIAALMAAMEFLAWVRTRALSAARYEAISALAPAGANVEEGRVTDTRVAAPLLPTVPGTGSFTTVPFSICGPVTWLPENRALRMFAAPAATGADCISATCCPVYVAALTWVVFRPALRDAGRGEMMMLTVPAYSEGDTAIQINPARNAMTVVRTTTR